MLSHNRTGVGTLIFFNRKSRVKHLVNYRRFPTRMVYLKHDIYGDTPFWSETFCDSSGESVVCLLVGCLTSQKHASVSQGQVFSDNFTCCHTETEVADQAFYVTQSQHTDTGPTSPSADPITPATVAIVEPILKSLV